jgi:hypothetical protein
VHAALTKSLVCCLLRGRLHEDGGCPALARRLGRWKVGGRAAGYRYKLSHAGQYTVLQICRSQKQKRAAIRSVPACCTTHATCVVHSPISHCITAALLLAVLLQLASKKWGVIGVEWRDVPCWYKPKTIAKLPSWTKPTPQPWWEKAPAHWNKAMDRRIGNKYQYQNGRKH